MSKNPYLNSECLNSNILGDVDLIIERFNSLTESYRLLVGAAEELTRIPSATGKIINAGIIRAAFLGNILDQLLLVIQITLLMDFIDTKNNPYV